jgi:MFS family permease
VAGLVGAVLAAPFLLKSGDTQATSDTAPLDPAAPGGAGDVGASPAKSRRTSSHIWVLAGLAFMLMLCEGVANDWSTLHLRDVLDAPAATAALAYGCFATAMTAGRFAADRVAGRFGAVAVLRYGSALAAVGLAAAAGTPVVPVALAGWSLFGLGLSGCIPQLFSAAGHADQAAAGANVSRVAGLGYLGMLAGPAVIGPLTRFMPLNVALFLPVAFCAVASVGGGGPAPPPPPAPSPALPLLRAVPTVLTRPHP